MPDAISRTEFDRLSSALIGQNEAFQNLIQASRKAQAQVEALYHQQCALESRIVALSAVCGTLARGLMAAGIPGEAVREAIDGTRALLPTSMRDAGAQAIDAVLALVPDD